MILKLNNCHGLNLINHLQQKNIPVQIKQYHYLSDEDFKAQKDNIEEEKVDFLHNRNYKFHIRMKEGGYDTWYSHIGQTKLSQKPLWRTELTFRNKLVYSLGHTKKESLVNAVNMLESHIRDYLFC